MYVVPKVPTSTQAEKDARAVSAPLLLRTDVDGSDQVLGTGSSAADPVFAETETCSLSPMSPCIDAGSGVDGSVRDLGWLPRG